MIEFITSILWWKWWIALVLFYLSYGITIRLYAEYKIPALRIGKWHKSFYLRLFLIKSTSKFIYALFVIERWILFFSFAITMISLLK